MAIEAVPGELIDKVTILEIKSERMGDPEKGPQGAYLPRCAAVGSRTIRPSDALTSLSVELCAVIEALNRH